MSAAAASAPTPSSPTAQDQLDQSSQKPQLYDWQLRVRWELKSVDDIPADAEQKVLPAASLIPASRRTRVTLPSGKILAVDAAVVLGYCSAFDQRSAEHLLNEVICSTYLPAAAADLWSDETVEEFFEGLHKAHVHPRHFNTMTMHAVYGALIDTFGVKELHAPYRCTVFRMLGGRAEQPHTDSSQHERFVWLGCFQLMESSNWKAPVLNKLCIVSPDALKLWTHGANRRRLLEAFTIEDVATLARLRWFGEAARSPPIHTASSWKRTRPLGEVVLNRMDGLPPALQLRIVISDEFSIICSRNVMEKKSPFIREAPVDEAGPIPTIHLPFAASFPEDEVLEFFNKVNNVLRYGEVASWKPSWVELADHLQIAELLDEAANWVWDTCRISMLIDWLPVTRLHSMQQRRPVKMINTLSEENIVTMLAMEATKCEDYRHRVADAFQRYDVRLVEFIGVDGFLDVLELTTVIDEPEDDYCSSEFYM